MAFQSQFHPAHTETHQLAGWGIVLAALLISTLTVLLVQTRRQQISVVDQPLSSPNMVWESLGR